MTRHSWQALLGAALVAFVTVAAHPLRAAERFTLVSAQVVTSTDRPQVLRVMASGPIAFRVVPPEEAPSAGADHLVLDLYGFDAGALSGTQVRGEFALTVQPGEGDAIRLTVAGPPHHRYGALAARLGTASHVLEVCACGR